MKEGSRFAELQEVHDDSLESEPDGLWEPLVCGAELWVPRGDKLLFKEQEQLLKSGVDGRGDAQLLHLNRFLDQLQATSNTKNSQKSSNSKNPPRRNSKNPHKFKWGKEKERSIESKKKEKEKMWVQIIFRIEKEGVTLTCDIGILPM